MDVQRDVSTRPQFRKMIACVAFRYGQGGPGERLCSRVAHDLALQFTVRILSLGKTESSCPGISFDSGIPVRSFSLDHEERSRETSDREPTSRELDVYLQSEKERYVLLLFFGTQPSHATEALLSCPGRTMFIPLEDAPKPPTIFKNVIFDGDEPETKRSVDRYLSILRRQSPALFYRYSCREMETLSPHTRRIYSELKSEIERRKSEKA